MKEIVTRYSDKNSIQTQPQITQDSVQNFSRNKLNDRYHRQGISGVDRNEKTQLVVCAAVKEKGKIIE